MLFRRNWTHVRGPRVSSCPRREADRCACIIPVVHKAVDVRIFHKQARTLAQNGWDVTLIAPSEKSE